MHKRSLGDLISRLYGEYLAIYGDPELASIATAATVNDFLSIQQRPSKEGQGEEAA
jgi:hypothetical protein